MAQAIDILQKVLCCYESGDDSTNVAVADYQEHPFPQASWESHDESVIPRRFPDVGGKPNRYRFAVEIVCGVVRRLTGFSPVVVASSLVRSGRPGSSPS